VEIPRVEAGTVAQGQVVEAVFEIVNQGNADLTISDVRPSCGCTVAEFDKAIRPGRKGRVLLKVETRGFTGPITKSALVSRTTRPARRRRSGGRDGEALRRRAAERLPAPARRRRRRRSAEVILASEEEDFAPTAAEPSLTHLKASLAPSRRRTRLPGKPLGSSASPSPRRPSRPRGSSAARSA